MNESERSDLVCYRISKANETMKEIEILVENKLWGTAVNRLYYACYYAVTALLAKHNIPAQTHTGVRQILGLHFVKTGIVETEVGRFYTYLFNKRQTGDYDDFVELGEEDVLSLIDPAKKLIASIELALSFQ